MLILGPYLLKCFKLPISVKPISYATVLMFALYCRPIRFSESLCLTKADM